jgi:hypothetical protein
MKEYITKLQSKPESTRKQILIVLMIVCMIIVGSVWLYGINQRFTTTESSKEVAAKDTKEGPFQVFSDLVSGAYRNMAASVGSISNQKADVRQDEEIELIVVDPYKKNQ